MRRPLRAILVAATTIGASFAVTVPQAHAGALLTWTGAESTSWNNPDNWSPNRVPVNTDSLYFPSEAQNKVGAQNDVPGLSVVDDIRIEDGYFMGIGAGGQGLIVNNGIRSDATEGQSTLSLNLTLGNSQAVTICQPEMSLTLGLVNLNGHNLTVNGGGTAIIDAVSGTGSVNQVAPTGSCTGSPTTRTRTQSFSGTITIGSGTLVANPTGDPNANPLAGVTSLTVAPGAALDVAGNRVTLPATTSFGNAAGDPATIRGSTGTLIGNVTIGQAGLALDGTSTTGSGMTISGTITGSSSNLRKIGSGVVTLGGGGTSFTTTVLDGVLVGNAPGALPGDVTIGDGSGSAESAAVRTTATNAINQAAKVTVLSDGLLQTTSGTQTLTGALALTGGHVRGAAAPAGLTLSGAMTVNAAATPAVLDGTITLGNVTVTVADGAAAPDLSVAETGVLSGSLTKAGPGSLGGTGTLGGLTVTDGSVTPGSSPGTLRTGPLNFNGGTYRVEITGSTPGAYDQIAVTGPVTILNTAVLQVVTNFQPAQGDVFRIIDNDGTDPVTGTFKDQPQGSNVLSNGFTISYTGGDGNDVVLTATGAPVPITPIGPNTPANTDPGTRLAGADRIATAIAVSQDSFPTAGGAGAVVIARSDDFADALAGTPLAHVKSAPLLLTNRNALDPTVRNEISRVLPAGGNIYLLGGLVALAQPIEDALKAAGYTVTRYGGADRYETATIIADRGLGNPNVVFLATGTNFADALTGGAAAARQGAAILLTAGSTMPTFTSAYLTAHPNAARFALGGPAAAAAPTATGIVGADRYETGVLVAQRFFATPTIVGVASGVQFPDGLSGGAHIARKQGPLILTSPTELPPRVQQYLAANKAGITSAYFYGGELAITEATKTAILQALT